MNNYEIMMNGNVKIGEYAIRDGEYWHNLCIHKGQTSFI